MTAVLPAADAFLHETFFYRGQPAFVAGIAGLAREALTRDQAVVIAAPQPRLGALRDELAGDAADIEFLDMAEVGSNPARIIAVWEDAVQRYLGSGRGLCGVGEPAFLGRRPEELVECQLHELLLNEAFGGGPGWRLVCPYDEQALPSAVRAGALRAHPVWSAEHERGISPGYDPAGVRDAFSAPLPAPTTPVLRGRFTAGDVAAVRRTVGSYARTCGLPVDQVEALELATTELATNSIRHGGGSGDLALWRGPDTVVVEVTDTGRLTDPLTGRRRPSLEQQGGRGVYLVHQLCDLTELRSSAQGTTFRVSMRL